MTEYICSECGGEFESDWTYEDAEKECVQNFGWVPDYDDRNIVCEDCYKSLLLLNIFGGN